MQTSIDLSHCALQDLLFKLARILAQRRVAVSTAAAFELVDQAPQAIHVVRLQGILHRIQTLGESIDEQLDDF